MKLIRFKRSEERIKGFSSPVEKAERTVDWFWIPLILTIVITMIIALRKIF